MYYYYYYYYCCTAPRRARSCTIAVDVRARKTGKKKKNTNEKQFFRLNFFSLHFPSPPPPLVQCACACVCTCVCWWKIAAAALSFGGPLSHKETRRPTTTAARHTTPKEPPIVFSADNRGTARTCLSIIYPTTHIHLSVDPFWSSRLHIILEATLPTSWTCCPSIS